MKRYDDPKIAAEKLHKLADEIVAQRQHPTRWSITVSVKLPKGVQGFTQLRYSSQP